MINTAAWKMEQERIRIAKQLRDQIEENEECMGEGAAYQAACEMLEIDPDDGYEIMAWLERGNNAED